MNKTILSPSREVPVILECDVLVLGAGMSGFAAAVTAARTGVRTVLAEKNHFPGGVNTSGLMCSITNGFLTKDGIQVTTGLPIEFIDRIVAEGGGEPDYLRPEQGQIPAAPEITKRVMIKMLREAGVTTLYESMLVDVIQDGGRVTHGIFQGRDQSYAVAAKQFVDASGDLSIFHRAGGQFEEKDDGASLLFRMANVDIDRLLDWFEQNPDSYSPKADVPTSLEDTLKNWRRYGIFHLPHFGGYNIKFVKDALESGAFSDTFGKHYMERACLGMFSCRANHGAVLINSNWYKGSVYDIIAESEREEEGRLQIESQADFLQKYLPGFENAYLLDSANEIGHRYSRKAICEKMYMREELRDAVLQNDCIGIVCRQAEQLPLSMLISKATPNVIVGSAKNLCTEKWGMIRSQSFCLVMGRGAGAAAAVAAQTGTDVVDVDVRKVQDELKKQGMKM